MRKAKGFAVIELVLVLVIVGIVAFVAYRIIQANGDVDTAQNQAPSSTADPQTPSVPAVNNTDDLGKLENQLNEQKIDDDTATQLDSQSSF
ncbi:MAG TPA: prepilin-type N-terminal cleavage/methylation domain-containing protein [Candidatus Saccharimonadales bacterium]|nr:prepilin-type N-terminal cleavage/methylation domain-containing protein [Candidatus Saccharimonadales bacterium]